MFDKFEIYLTDFFFSLKLGEDRDGEIWDKEKVRCFQLKEESIGKAKMTR